MYEDGVGIVRTFEREFTGEVDEPTNTAAGFCLGRWGAPKVTEPSGTLSLILSSERKEKPNRNFDRGVWGANT